jgi:G3E family GTPase
LTVVGGFLGAGKTTLVNALLARGEGRRIAVLVNDFGELAIDAALVAARSETTISLQNGCVCCSLVGGLAQALLDILEYTPRPDHVVIEASGVSDPRRIAQVARAAPEFRHEATLVVADADQIETHASDRYVGETVIAQLASADLILLNKRDLIGADRARSLQAWLRANAPRASVIETIQSELPTDLVLGPVARVEFARPRASSPTVWRDGTARAPNADHLGRFSALTFRCASPIPEAAMHHALDALPDAVLRAKGWVRFDSAPSIAKLVQLVGRRWTITAAPAGADASESGLTLIGATHALAGADLSAMGALFAASPDSINR